jgi:DNA polymerase-1
LLFPELSQFRRIAADTETTGTGRQDRPVGLSWSLPDGRKTYLAWGHPVGNNCTKEQARTWWNQEVAKRDDLVTAFHNAPFDMRMLAYEGFEMPRRPEDTGVVCALLNELEHSFSLDALGKKYAGREKSDDALNAWCAQAFGGKPIRKAQVGNYCKAPGTIVAEYAADDADVTLALYQVTRPQIDAESLQEIYEVETRLIPVLHRMHMAGVRVDTDKADSVKAGLEETLEKLRSRWHDIAGRTNPNSTKQLAELFRRLGIDVWKTAAGNDSIPKELLEYSPHEACKILKRMRQLDHYVGTFIDSYIIDNAIDEVIYGEFHQVKRERYGTVSGRLSSGGALNLQNLPKRDAEIAPLIRGLFVPWSREHDWVKYDYSQIEYRFLAHYAGGQLRRLYNEQPDIDFHQMVADLASIPRGPAKNINFGLVYGMGKAKLARQLGVSDEEAEEIFASYHTRVPEVKKTYNKATRLAARRGYVLTWGGRKRRFMKTAAGKYAHTHKALNGVLQGSAGDLIKRAMVDIDGEIDYQSTIMHLTVHDELDFSVLRGDTKQVARLKDIMEHYELTVPVKAEVEIGPDWGHTA